MSRKTHGLKGLGLTLLALCGLMAVMAASAQANWLVNGAELAANESVSVAKHTTGKLSVPGLNFEIRCEVIEAEGLKLLANSEKAEGKVKFRECTGYEKSTGTAQKNCKPAEPIVAGGTALIILHNSRNYVLLAPSGKNFTEVKLSELCALAESAEVTGSLVVECGTLNASSEFAGEDCNVSRSVHLIQPAPAALFPEDKLKYGENAATLEGIASVTLSGVNAGNPWAGHV